LRRAICPDNRPDIVGRLGAAKVAVLSLHDATAHPTEVRAVNNKTIGWEAPSRLANSLYSHFAFSVGHTKQFCFFTFATLPPFFSISFKSLLHSFT
jgi:hypothetical protein